MTMMKRERSPMTPAMTATNREVNTDITQIRLGKHDVQNTGHTLLFDCANHTQYSVLLRGCCWACCWEGGHFHWNRRSERLGGVFFIWCCRVCVCSNCSNSDARSWRYNNHGAHSLCLKCWLSLLFTYGVFESITFCDNSSPVTAGERK